MNTHRTPSKKVIAGLPAPVAVPVSDVRKSRRTRTIKTPYDPDATPFVTTTSVPYTLPPIKVGPPQCARIVIERDNVQGLLNNAAICRKCKKGQLIFSTKDIGIASLPSIECNKCKVVYSEKLTATEYIDKKTNHDTLTDYSINVLYVLGFLTVGDGGSEAQRLLGLCDLPNYTSMEKKTFSRIEQTIAPVILEIAEEVMWENLCDEVASSNEHCPDFDIEKWKDAVLNADGNYAMDWFAKIKGTTDMGWQKLGSGFDSLSGHAFFFGAEKRRALVWKFMNKYCRICSLVKDGEAVKEHECTINHNGSASSMEPLAVVDMVHELNDKFKCHLTTVITDDDSKMKANCRWSNMDYFKHYGCYPMVADGKGKMKKRKCTGKLRYPIPQSSWLMDPNHRCKLEQRDTRKLANKKVKDTCGCLEIDVLRVSTNFKYFTRQLTLIPESEWSSRATAIVGHHFDLHDCCGAFCKRKEESLEERKLNNKFYRDVTKDAALFEALNGIVSKYTTTERLKEVAHNFDTNPNESMNNIIAWIAPKNKCYSGSASLTTRIGVAISTQSMGFEDFFVLLFSRLGIAMTKGTKYWLEMQEKRRELKKANAKLLSTKRHRQTKHYEKVREKTVKAKEDIANDTGYYKGAGIEAEEIDDGKPKKKKARQACKCGYWSHQRSNSLLCPLNPVYTSASKEKIDELVRNGEAQAALDTLGPDQESMAKYMNDKSESSCK